MSYGDLIKDTFRIVRHNRYLWFFGLFSGTSFGGSFNFSSSGGSDTGAPQDGFVPGLDAGAVIAILAALLLILVVAIVLTIVSQGALAEIVAAIERGERRGFGSAWRAGTARFWPVLAQVVLIAVGTLLLLLLIVGPLVGVVIAVLSATDSIAARIVVVGGAALLGFVAVILVLVPLYIVVQLSLRELILGARRVADALRGGWGLFRRNPGRTLLLFLIQQGIAIGAAIAAVLALVVVGLVLFIPTIVLATAGSTTAAIVTGVVAGLILLPLALTAFGAIGAFNHGYWTLAYLRLEAWPAR